MIQSPPDEEGSVTRKRGLKGTSCYTCRIRKVKCNGTGPSSPSDPSSSRGQNGATSEQKVCSNCARLKFDCRWSKPRPGEKYTPPPKKRRTFDHGDYKRRRSEGTSHHNDPSDENGQSSRSYLLPPVSRTTGINVNSTPPRAPVSQMPLSSPLDPDLTAILPARLPHIGNHNDTPLNNPVYPQAEFDFPAHIEDYIPGLNGLTNDDATPWDTIMGLDFFMPIADNNLTYPSTQNIAQDQDQAKASGSADWVFDPGPSLAGASMASSQHGGHSGVGLDSEERILIQHYLEVMKTYAKVEDRKRETNNLYIHAFSKALSLPPLYDAILAYSSLHLSLSDPSRVIQAETYSLKASTSLSSAVDGEMNGETEGLLAATFILVKREHMAATPQSLDRILHLLDIARQIVGTDQGASALGDPNGFARRVVLRLAFKDCRAANFRLGGGGLLEVLKRIAGLEDIFEVKVDKSASEVVKAGGGGGGLLRANLLRLRVAKLDQRIHDFANISVNSPIIRSGQTVRPVGPLEVNSLRQDLERELRRYEVAEEDDDLEEVLDSGTYNQYVIVGALHSALLYLHRIYPDPRWSPQPSIDRILSIHLSFQNDPSRTPTPSSILPISLFFAGLCTSDKIHRAWIIQKYQAASSWGTNIAKTMGLLQEMWAREKREKRELDVKSVMEDTTGYLLM